MGGDGKEGLVPFLETAKITSLKIVRRYNKMIDAKGNGKCGGQVTDEKVPIGCLCIPIRASTMLSQKTLSSTSCSPARFRKQ